MFGLGGRKKEQAKAPRSIQILTRDYLIDATWDAESYNSGGVDFFEQLMGLAADAEEMDEALALRFSEARLQPAGNLTTPAGTFADWELPYFDQVVAIVPRDEAGLQAAQKAFGDFANPRNAILYAGPYLIRANLLSDDEDQSASPFATAQVVPLTDAVIDCQLPGSKLTGFHVPWLLLNGATLHGWAPA